MHHAFGGDKCSLYMNYQAPRLSINATAGKSAQAEVSAARAVLPSAPKGRGMQAFRHSRSRERTSKLSHDTSAVRAKSPSIMSASVQLAAQARVEVLSRHFADEKPGHGSAVDLSVGSGADFASFLDRVELNGCSFHVGRSAPALLLPARWP